MIQCIFASKHFLGVFFGGGGGGGRDFFAFVFLHLKQRC